MHPRNRYQGHYDLADLIAVEPALSHWITYTPTGQMTLKFGEPHAVKLLNKALLKYWYNLEWDLPEEHLYPPIPGRADYVHHLADLLAQDITPYCGPQIKVLDIGTGANCIYPLIAQAEYGWRMTGSDIQRESLLAAQQILQANSSLSRSIRLRRQKNKDAIFEGIIQQGEFYHATMCNPPFHNSEAAAIAGTRRKNENLGIAEPERLNFSGRSHELWCSGGEVGFLGRMIEESIEYRQQVLWFTSLVSKQQSLPGLKKQLRRFDVPVISEIEMHQGNKKSRLLVWSFYNKDGRKKQLKPA